MKKIASTLLTIFIMVLFPLLSFAHAGHGHENPLSPDHYIANSVHATQVALTITVIVIFTVWMWQKATSKK